MNFLLKRHLSRGHSISCPAHHLERTDSKPFSELIVSRHMNTSRAVTHQNWVARCFPRVLHFSELTQYFVFVLHFPHDIKTVATMANINYCYCLIASGKWRSIIWCRKINIISFNFLGKSYWEFFLSWICIPVLEYLVKLFVFERYSYFWKKHTLTLTFNFGCQNYPIFMS